MLKQETAPSRALRELAGSWSTLGKSEAKRHLSDDIHDSWAKELLTRLKNRILPSLLLENDSLMAVRDSFPAGSETRAIVHEDTENNRLEIERLLGK